MDRCHTAYMENYTVESGINIQINISERPISLEQFIYVSTHFFNIITDLRRMRQRLLPQGPSAQARQIARLQAHQGGAQRPGGGRRHSLPTSSRLTQRQQQQRPIDSIADSGDNNHVNNVIGNNDIGSTIDHRHIIVSIININDFSNFAAHSATNSTATVAIATAAATRCECRRSSGRIQKRHRIDGQQQCR